MKKHLYILFIINIFTLCLYSELQFNPIALNQNDKFLFNSIESLAGKDYNKTLFYGYKDEKGLSFKAASFYPEHFLYSAGGSRLFVHNKMGLYSYDSINNKIEEVSIFPNYNKKNEYVIFDLPVISISPNFRYVVGKTPTSSVKAAIYLYDIANNSADEIVQDAEINPGKPVCYWSKDSNYFIYQKKDKVYYFSVVDYKLKKLLTEEWRELGSFNITNTRWTDDNYLIWIEDNIIYKADPNQFFSRSIYKRYLRQGVAIGKVPFDFDPSFDSFKINYNAKKFIIIKNYQSIFYYSLVNDLKNNPYLQLNGKMRCDDAYIFDDGDAVLIIEKLSDGKVKKDIYLLKKEGSEYIFKKFDVLVLNDARINSISIGSFNKDFVVNSSKGSFCYDFDELSLKWEYSPEQVIQSINTAGNEWIVGGEFTTVKFNTDKKSYTPLFASSFSDAGFVNEKIGVVCNKSNYFIDPDKMTLEKGQNGNTGFYKDPKNQKYRIISRNIDKGFYKDGVYLKDLYTGKLLEITASPDLRYSVYQPELKLGPEYYNAPRPEKYEVALVFNCIKSAEGIFPIVTKLKNYNIKATFFINGDFMDINPEITGEIGAFDFEIGNLFQYYVNLTDTTFLIDKNFIRQGLSANEEKFYRLSGKNFSPIWHSPMYAFNETIIKYGKESGYNFISYNLDSLDWVGKDSREVHPELFLNNSGLIERLLKAIKPGQIIIFNAGKSGNDRSDWLFNDLDL